MADWRDIAIGLGSGVDRGINTLGAIQNLQNRQKEQERLDRIRPMQEDILKNQGIIQGINARRAEAGARKVPVLDALNKAGFSTPEEQKVFLSRVPFELEDIGGQPHVEAQAGKEHFMSVLSDPAAKSELLTIKAGQIDSKLKDLDRKMSDVTFVGSLGPDEIKQLGAQRNMLMNGKEQIARSLREIQLSLKGGRMVNVPQGSALIDPMNPEKPVYANPKEEVPYSASSGVIYDKRTGKPVYVKPDSASSVDNKTKMMMKIVNEYIKKYENLIKDNPLGDLSKVREQLKIAENTKAYLINGGDPDKIKVPQTEGQMVSQKEDFTALVSEAKDAISRGADPEKVKARLREKGYNGSI